MWRLVWGTGGGGRQRGRWGGMSRVFLAGLVPLASQPVAMSGRNWLTRRIRIEALRNASDAAAYSLPLAQLMTESVVRLQEMAPSREAADELYRKLVEDARRTDPINQLYAIESVIDYDPTADLHKIRARLVAINFADDALNPPELGVVEPAIQRIPRATFVLVPAGPETHGHYTYFRAAMWKPYLAELMRSLEARQP